jgi:hypothetical protein
MKYLLLLLMVSPAYGVDWAEHPYDKLSHVAIGGAISCAVTAKTDNKLYGFLAALGVGAIKEATDKNWDNGDFASWGVGGAVGTLCIRF